MLLEYRLPSAGTAYDIKGEWHSVVEGTHRLWKVSRAIHYPSLRQTS